MATDYNQLLCEKMQKEFDNLIEKFKSKEPAEILKHTYELSLIHIFYHICEFAEHCERNGHTVEPAEKTTAPPKRNKTLER